VVIDKVALDLPAADPDTTVYEVYVVATYGETRPTMWRISRSRSIPDTRALLNALV